MNVPMKKTKQKAIEDRKNSTNNPPVGFRLAFDHSFVNYGAGTQRSFLEPSGSAAALIISCEHWIFYTRLPGWALFPGQERVQPLTGLRRPLLHIQS